MYAQPQALMEDSSPRLEMLTVPVPYLMLKLKLVIRNINHFIIDSALTLILIITTRFKETVHSMFFRN